MTARNFGLVIAYLIPGFLALSAVSLWSEPVRDWLLLSAGQGPQSLGSFLYAVLASLSVGLTLSGFRWAIIDSLHHATGLSKPSWNYGLLPKRLQAFEAVVEAHYQYYQFYSNSLVALVFGLVGWATTAPVSEKPSGFIYAGFVFFALVFLAASRDTLRKYYARGSEILATSERSSGGPSNDKRARST